MANSKLNEIVVDITERQQSKQVVRENEAKYRMLLEHSSDAVIVFDESGKFLEANQKFQKLLRYTREELFRLQVHDLVSDKELLVMPISYDELRVGKIVRRKGRLRRKDGSLVCVGVVGSMIGKGKFQFIVRDCSEPTPPGKVHRDVSQLVVQSVEGSDGETAAPLNGKLKHLKDVSIALLAAVESLEQASTTSFESERYFNRELTFYEAVKDFEISLIKRALEESEGNQTKAAALLGINHTTLHAMIKRHQIKVRYTYSSHDFGKRGETDNS